ncbi:MAG: sulfite exporter TauE/SafE family protein [Pseudomonadota bacterium]|nr:sulfite exporter TauE/SafE family protein [Pseudomonadota bacterium]
MAITASAGELVTLALLLLAGGALTGILAGLFGVGGGAVIVPVLYQLFAVMDVPESVRMHLCVGTSLAAIVPTSIRSFRAHVAHGVGDTAVLRRWAVPVVAGVASGSLAAAFIASEGLRGIFAVIAAAVGSRFLLGRDDWRLADDLPGPVGMAAYGYGIGLCSAFMGVGGGALSTLVMMLHNRPIHQAVATSAGLGILVSVPGMLGYAISGLPQRALLPPLSIGYVSLIGAALITPVSMLTAPVGVRLAHRFRRRQLQYAFGVFLLAVAARFLVSLIV